MSASTSTYVVISSYDNLGNNLDNATRRGAIFVQVYSSEVSTRTSPLTGSGFQKPQLPRACLRQNTFDAFPYLRLQRCCLRASQEMMKAWREGSGARSALTILLLLQRLVLLQVPVPDMEELLK